MGRHTQEIAKRFWEKVEKTENCWNWKGALNINGYPVIVKSNPLSDGRKAANLYARRIAWELMGRKLEMGKKLLNTCKNRACVNPDHQKQKSGD